MKYPTIAFIVVSISFTMVACGADSPTDPGSGNNGGGSNGTLPEPIPGGTLLDGGASDDARAAVKSVAPTPSDPADVTSDGRLSNRLDAIIANDATVGEVNTAMQSHNVNIVAMVDGLPFVTLKTERLDETAAATLAKDLVATGAFSYAGPAWQAAVSPIEVPAAVAGPDRIYPEGGEDEIPHLKAMYFPSAWNVEGLAAANAKRIPVLVPDHYVTNLDHAEIDAHHIAGWGDLTPLAGNAIYPGNHGFAVSGVIGANFDDTPVTGTNPHPNDLLEIVSLKTGGLSWFDIINMMAWHVGTSGERFVVNTSIGWNDPFFLSHSGIDRMAQILAWRMATANHYHKFVHVASAGSYNGDAQLNSIFTATHYYDDLRPIVEADPGATQADRDLAEVLWQDVSENYPLATALQNNVIVVGSSDETGAPSGFTNSPYHVRAVGERVAAPCQKQDPGYTNDNGYCDGAVAHYSGTSMAAPQIAGLAAYMMNLRPEVDPLVIRSKIISKFDESRGTVDAFAAVLSLDNGLDDASVRRALLDVTGTPPITTPNGRFDEYDIEEILDNFSRTLHSRYDINGDAAGQRSPFDLDADGSYSVVPVGPVGTINTVDENRVGEADMLCYYAYSPLYQGTIDGRQDQLGYIGYFTGLFCTMEVELRSLEERYEDETEGHLLPQRLFISQGNENALVEAGGKVAHLKVAANSLGSDEDAASANMLVRDRFRIIDPAKEGETGTITVRYSLTGDYDVTPGGCDNEDPDAQVNWYHHISLNSDGSEVNGLVETCDGLVGDPLPGVVTFDVDFTYGSGIQVALTISLHCDGDPGIASGELNWKWEGIVNFPAGATLESNSGIDWSTPWSVTP